MKFRITDKVIITAGKNKGKQGKIKTLLPKSHKVVVAGINTYKKHLKPQQTSGKGQIVEKERPLPTANIALICPKCKKPTRVGYLIDAKGKKNRQCAKCKSVITTKVNKK